MSENKIWIFLHLFTLKVVIFYYYHTIYNYHNNDFLHIIYRNLPLKMNQTKIVFDIKKCTNYFLTHPHDMCFHLVRIRRKFLFVFNKKKIKDHQKDRVCNLGLHFIFRREKCQTWWTTNLERNEWTLYGHEEQKWYLNSIGCKY